MMRGKWFLLLLKRADLGEEQAAHRDDSRVTGAEALARAVDIHTHALLHGLILRGEAVDSRHRRVALLAAVNAVVIILVAVRPEGGRVDARVNEGLLPDGFPILIRKR